MSIYISGAQLRGLILSTGASPPIPQMLIDNFTGSAPLWDNHVADTGQLAINILGDDPGSEPVLGSGYLTITSAASGGGNWGYTIGDRTTQMSDPWAIEMKFSSLEYPNNIITAFVAISDVGLDSLWAKATIEDDTEGLYNVIFKTPDEVDNTAASINLSLYTAPYVFRFEYEPSSNIFSIKLNGDLLLYGTAGTPTSSTDLANMVVFGYLNNPNDLALQLTEISVDNFTPGNTVFRVRDDFSGAAGPAAGTSPSLVIPTQTVHTWADYGDGSTTYVLTGDGGLSYSKISDGWTENLEWPDSGTITGSWDDIWTLEIKFTLFTTVGNNVTINFQGMDGDSNVGSLVLEIDATVLKGYFAYDSAVPATYSYGDVSDLENKILRVTWEPNNSGLVSLYVDNILIDTSNTTSLFTSDPTCKRIFIQSVNASSGDETTYILSYVDARGDNSI